MNRQKFLFVTNVNDEISYYKCQKHIQNLAIPAGFSIDFLPIRGAKSITEAYNQALSDDAKYKIYIHQDTFIINTFFLENILELFRSNPALGLIGIAGCKKLPVEGYWWDGVDLVGKVIIEYNQTFIWGKFREVAEAFEPVEGIDGMLMVTQYDVPWPKRVIDGSHFYDSSHALEFIKRGYLVGVPQQVEPWCIKCEKKPDLAKYEKFLQYCGKCVLPQPSQEITESNKTGRDQMENGLIGEYKH
jgi:hypothetical protein